MEVRGDQVEAPAEALVVLAAVVAPGVQVPVAMAVDLVDPQDLAANRLIWKI
ncbi:MAG: hypothetical protein Rhims3KO_23140 [Hyphomicrobiales bacterium]